MGVLTVKNLETHYNTKTGPLRALDKISFDLDRGESLGIAGESGCGKSTIAMSLMRLLRGGNIVDGDIVLNGKSLIDIPDHGYNDIRMKKIALISQAAMGGLNPVYTVGSQISEALIVRNKMKKKKAFEKAKILLEMVEIDPSRIKSYPHELSGGMKQRVMIAMALALDPEIIIADEPTTALDVITQARILKLLNRLRVQMDLCVLFISHDLSILAQTCDRIMIMYAGKRVEIGTVEELFLNPIHPYTKALVSSFPDISGKIKRLKSLPGIVPDLQTKISGCSFYSRCNEASKRCKDSIPGEVRLTKTHIVSCGLTE